MHALDLSSVSIKNATALLRARKYADAGSRRFLFPDEDGDDGGDDDDDDDEG